MCHSALRNKYSAKDEYADYEDEVADYKDEDEEVNDGDEATNDEDEDTAVKLELTDGSNIQHNTDMGEQNFLDELEEVYAKGSPEWLGTLTDASNSDVFTGKVKATTELIDHLHNTYPTEKILLFSVFLTHLDLVHEALKRANAH
jgi:SNF2 family DNA or RNA helicase